MAPSPARPTLNSMSWPRWMPLTGPSTASRSPVGSRSPSPVTCSCVQLLRAAQSVPGQGIVFFSPKTARSRRSVELSAAALRVLRQHRTEQAEHRLRVGPSYEDHGLVFAQPTGKPYEPSYISHKFPKLVQSAGLRKLRFHDLRHTAATFMLLANTHPKVVSERLGPRQRPDHPRDL